MGSEMGSVRAIDLGSTIRAGRGRAARKRRRTVARAPFRVGLLFIAAIHVAAAHAATSWTSFEPTGQGLGTVCIRVGEEEATYCLLDSRPPVEFSLQGPSKLRILSRHLPRDGHTSKRCYTISVEMDGAPLKAEPQLAVESSSATLCGLRAAPVGAACETIATIPNGSHNFRVFVEEGRKEVAARFFRERKTAEVTYAGFAPQESEQVCTLVEEDGKEYAHYHFSGQKPLRFTVNGPTSLLLRTRLDFVAGESAATTYSLEVARRSEPGGAWEIADTLSHTTTPVTGSAYKECPQIIPGESRRADIEVPEGLWIFEVRAVATDGRGLTARILIPKDDIGLGS